MALPEPLGQECLTRLRGGASHDNHLLRASWIQVSHHLTSFLPLLQPPSFLKVTFLP